MTHTIKSIEREKYTEYELADLANDVYGDEEVIVLGMPMQSLYILKQLDKPAYSELLEGLQEYVDYYICPMCQDEYLDEFAAENCHPEIDTESRIEELEEMKSEFILNESWIDEDKSPSWGDVAEANAEAESKWDETDDGKELKSLLELDN